MKLSKEQKNKAIIELSHPFGRVDLMCDGYRVELRVERANLLTFRIMTYVNGHFRGIWFDAKNEAPEQKFLRKSVRPVCPAAHKKEMVKLMGKRNVAKDPYFSKTFSRFHPDWASGKAALNHLCKVCDSVQIIEPQAAVAEPV